MRKALVVGIDNYKYAPIVGCINDANSITQCLKTNGDGSPNFDILEKNDIDDKNYLLDLITALFETPAETALFYFSGHGCREKNESYIVTAECKRGADGISMTELLKIVNDSKAINKIVILDSCYSGNFGTSCLFDNLTHISDGVTILTGSMGNQTSVAKDGHGVFTKLLLEALEGGAANINGKITPGSIYSYVDQALDAWEQRPVFKTNTHSFVVVRSVLPLLELTALRNITKYFPSPTDEYKLNPSYEFTNSKNYEHEIKEPYADEKNVVIMKQLQQMERVGLIKPFGEDYMYFAAMNSKGCRLTALGNHYWQLVKKGKI